MKADNELMSNSKRKLNERKYYSREQSEDGGRKYQKKVEGKKGWFAIYLKSTDKNEETVDFRQLIYNNLVNLEEIHVKYPINSGHIKIQK